MLRAAALVSALRGDMRYGSRRIARLSQELLSSVTRSTKNGNVATSRDVGLRTRATKAMLIPAHCRRSRSGNELQIEKMVGRTMVVSGNTPMAQQGRCRRALARATGSQTMTLIVTLVN